MNRFEAKLAGHRLSLRRSRLRTLQVNVGRKCNQACRHCHVNAAPWRTEMMSAEVARRVGEWINAHRPAVVDITGGASDRYERQEPLRLREFRLQGPARTREDPGTG